MKVIVENLPPEGRTVAAGLEDPWFAAAVRTAAEQKPRGGETLLTVKRAEAAEGFFRVTGTLHVQWHQACDRCVRLVRVDLRGDVDLQYQKGGVPDEEEVDLESEALDTGWFEGSELDLSDVVCEQVALWLPDRVLCDDDGVSRIDSEDAGPCALPEQEPGPDLSPKSPFSSLANWKPPK